MNKDYLRKDEESFLDYADRLLEGKKNGLYDIDYTEMYELLFEKTVSSDEGRKRSYMLRDIVVKIKEEEERSIENKTELQKLREKISEFDIKKRQLQIEKTGLNRMKNEIIPAITVADELKQFMIDNNFEVNVPDYCYPPVEITSENEMIVHITDWHIGYVINNCKGNYFNWKIANQRIDKLIDDINKYVRLYNIQKIYVVNTGDVIEQNYMRKNQSQFCEFGLSQQINKSIELIYRFLVALCEKCEVEYDSIPGNHDRMSGDKKESHKGDHADVVIREQLFNYNEIDTKNKRLTIVKRSPYDTEIIKEINGTKHKFIHGDDKKAKDPKQLLKTEMSMDDEQYNLWMGHYHNFSVQSENNGRYIITTGCLSGYNDYSTNFGCTTWASQTIGIVSDGKIESIKDVQLQ